MRALLRRDSVQLAGALAAAGLLAVLFRTGESTATGNYRSPAARTAMGEIALPDLNGRLWKLSDQRGSVVLVNFWASWCPPCREETPGLVRISGEYRSRGLKVAGISLDSNTASVRQFASRFGVPYPILLPGADSALSSTIESLPTSFLVDREGRVAKVYIGAVREPDLARDIERLLAEAL